MNAALKINKPKINKLSVSSVLVDLIKNVNPFSLSVLRKTPLLIYMSYYTFQKQKLTFFTWKNACAKTISAE